MMQMPEREPLEKDVLEGPVQSPSGEHEPPPLEKDVLEGPVQQRQIGQNSERQSPMFLWGLIFLGVIALLLIGGRGLLHQEKAPEKETGPFFQVTNRQLSVFQWQNPQYFRVGSSSDLYVKAQGAARVELADKLTTAPQEMLFLYHTWDRLLSGYVMTRPIPMDEFMEFLDYAKEWAPANWPGGPEDYKQWIAGMKATEGDSLHAFRMENLQSMSLKELPKEVRNAFIGWKNRFREADRINDLSVTVDQMRVFLGKYPNYARNNWRNIYPNYLETLMDKDADEGAKIADGELEPFLKAAFFNYQQSQ